MDDAAILPSDTAAIIRPLDNFVSFRLLIPFSIPLPQEFNIVSEKVKQVGCGSSACGGHPYFVCRYD